MAPQFRLSTLDGHELSLSEFRGRIVVVNFWATWCAPCRVEMPWLSELGIRYRAKGLTILGVSVDDEDRDRVGRFVRDRKVTYPILLKDGDVEARYGGVQFLPQTFFIDRRGRVTERIYGMRTQAQWEADIRHALGLAQPLR